MNMLLLVSLLFLNFSTASADQNAVLEPALKLAVASKENGNKLHRTFYCSGSVVEYNGKNYIATAEHCLGRENYYNFVHLYTSHFIGKLEREEQILQGDGVLYYAESYSSTGRIEVQFIDISKQISVYSAEYQESINNQLQERWTRVLTDGLLVEIEETKEQLLEKSIPTLQLASSSEISPGTILEYSGYPADDYKNGSCRVVTRNYFDEIVNENCVGKFKEDLTQMSDFFIGSALLECNAFSETPVGASGSPIRISGTNKLAGILSVAPTDPERYKNMQMNPKTIDEMLITDQQVADLRSCYEKVNKFLFMTPITQETVKNNSKQAF